MQPRIVEVRRKILKRNDELAREMRDSFRRHDVYVVNLVSGPGAGKTELLEHTLKRLLETHRAAAVTGDLATENDAARLASSGAPAKQILTGTMCHLEATMVSKAIAGWELADLDFLFIENVGNLVCPSGWDLGEDLRVLLMAVTEGEDKPLKYPTLVNTADVVVLSKIDLAGPVEFDSATAERNIQLARPGVPVLKVSAKTGQGLDDWMALIRSGREAKCTSSPSPSRS